MPSSSPVLASRPGFDDLLAPLIDHTLLRPDAAPADVERLCEEARRYGFAAACVLPVHVSLAARLLAGTTVRVATVVGFPLGANRQEVKALEAARAVADGARELDMVLALWALRGGRPGIVEEEIRGVIEAAGRDAIVKVILETALLRREEIEAACQLALRAGAHFVKTSTGHGPGGATVEDVALLHSLVGGRMGIKASGGIRDRVAAWALLRAGATRIGTSGGPRVVALTP